MMKNDKATCKYNKNGVPNPVAQAKSKHLEKPEESEATGTDYCGGILNTPVMHLWPHPAVQEKFCVAKDSAQ